ncbi:unnamed protein product [Parnassius apollo]|uniref:(apollo) hypothetical protein n=1 Tax=Parnassius apollo TaxID=110799 RepID=A0A8S3X4V2_PARAO|nr:unnamed protein product [Parnassius apollo]
MYKKTANRQEQMDKKIDTKQAKDRGDSPKKINVNLDKLNLNTIYNNNASKNVLYDRGDSKKPKKDLHTKYDGSKNNKAVEVNSPVKAVTNLTKRNNEVYDDSVSQNQNKIFSEVKPQPSINSKTVEWKKSREKNIINKKPQYQKTNQKPDHPTDLDLRKAKIKEVITIPYKPLEDIVIQEIEDDSTGQENQIMSSTSSKISTMKISKAVSFKDPLNISNILGSNHINTRYLDANSKRQVVINKTKVQNTLKTSKRRRKKKNNSQSSNESDINEFPPTKVAQWAPSCLTSHTRPYYEAWVDTSVTAVSRCSEKEKLMIEKELIKSFQESKRPVTPEEMYGNFNVEKFMGRIIVRHRHLGVKSEMSNHCSAK